MAFPTFGIAVLLVVLVAALVSLPSAQGVLRSWWGSTALALLMLVGYGAAVGSLGASATVHARTKLGRRLPPVVSLAPPVLVLLLVGPPAGVGAVIMGSATWGAIVVSLLALRTASTQRVRWTLRAVALGLPSWLLAALGVGYLAATGSPHEVVPWLLPAQLAVVVGGIVVVPAILVTELVDAFSAEGWIGRWLTPESERRAWAALTVKTTATIALVIYLGSQGIALAGWGQSAIVALLVLVLLALEPFVSFGDLRHGTGVGGRLRVSITVAMAAVGVLVVAYLLLMALLRPLTLAGLLLVALAVMFTPELFAHGASRIITVTGAGVVASWAWAVGPTIGLAPTTFDPLNIAVVAIIVVFLGAVVVQVFLALRDRQLGFPVLVIAVAAGPLAHVVTHERAGVAPVNLLVLPALALALLLGRRFRRRLVETGEVIRWSVLSLIAIDVTAAATLATGPVKAGLLGLSLVALGITPLLFSPRGVSRVRTAGLVCALFTAFAGTLSVSVHLTDSTNLIELLDDLSTEFFWIIAFPVSAALSAAAAPHHPGKGPHTAGPTESPMG
ncbi:hypothetical protein ET989_01965 [Propioniciclava sinopodophylli]|uniref:Uncharacterized protein n=1 Tax=Propioniciclava sinopodophylli TaxID=1837344 RepID=A0A4Q9KH99_9ACTN|nr:hypothetical protein [Propioniciclava sinopodophylli]TBT88723.1 hypothetical protein ET989_01965 [Propioniciclava sinopodophylli]